MPRVITLISSLDEDNAKKPIINRENKAKKYHDKLKSLKPWIDAIRDTITETENNLELMMDMPELTEEDIAEQQQLLFRHFATLDDFLRKEKKYRMKYQLAVKPVPIFPIPDEESEDEDCILINVIDLTKDN